MALNKVHRRTKPNLSALGATFFNPATPPIAFKGIVYLLPLTYTSTKVCAAYLPNELTPEFRDNSSAGKSHSFVAYRAKGISGPKVSMRNP